MGHQVLERRRFVLPGPQDQREKSKEEIEWLNFLSRHREAWESLGDKVATSIMTTGLELEFTAPPPLSYLPPPNAISSESSSDGTSPWNRFSLRVPSYGSMDPSPKANYLGTRVLQNDSTVEKNNWTRSYFSRNRRKFTLGSG